MNEAPPQLDPAQVQAFVANAHGDVEVVRSLLTEEPSVLSDFPEMHNALGPHGIPLVEHARTGGADARAVLASLEATEVAS